MYEGLTIRVINAFQSMILGIKFHRNSIKKIIYQYLNPNSALKKKQQKTTKQENRFTRYCQVLFLIHAEFQVSTTD